MSGPADSLSRVGICSEWAKYAHNYVSFPFALGVVFEGNDALIALHIDALVDGHCEMSLAEQRRGCRGIETGDRLAIEPCVAAHLARRCEVGDDHVDRSRGIGLQDEFALEFERGA